MTASAIAEGVTAGTGKRIFVDEARPDALRLRLRFLNGDWRSACQHFSQVSISARPALTG